MLIISIIHKMIKEEKIIKSKRMARHDFIQPFITSTRKFFMEILIDLNCHCHFYFRRALINMKLTKLTFVVSVVVMMFATSG